MIVEQLPEVQKLSPEMKLALAAELFEEATEFLPGSPDPEVVALLDERLAEYRAKPEETAPWSEVKARILRSRDT
ncbi:MAG: addiction module protein [Verrucomicrobia bacterium]|jgi:hypothetical protein|nr:addiction module protein [Verrucomicrobiota bacterium]